MAWHQISVTTDEASAADLADYLTELGALSVTYMDAEDQPVYEPPLNEVKVWNKTRVVALFDAIAHPAVIRGLIGFELKHIPLENWQQEVIKDQAWERTWLDHFKPMLFANRLWICPSGMEITEADRICMTLDPGLAFGTGTHPTTALCLEWLAQQDLHDKTVIDFGCGSGILAIAALLLGARNAHAIDIDPQALTATLMNAEKNQVADKIQCYLPDAYPGSTAQLVIANILALPLIQLNQNISDLVAPAGQLILSGILCEQSDAVIEAYASQFHFAAPAIEADWCRLEATKKSS